NSYINLRCGRGEISRRNIYPWSDRKKIITFEQERFFISYGLLGFSLHTVFLLFPLIPVLLVSASISGIPIQGFTRAFSVLFTTSLLCRMFGFMIHLSFGKWRVITKITRNVSGAFSSLI
ncbi:hypothetical protein ACFLZG_07825, partial [Thermodesulfobacteriota bacterium]